MSALREARSFDACLQSHVEKLTDERHGLMLAAVDDRWWRPRQARRRRDRIEQIERVLAFWTPVTRLDTSEDAGKLIPKHGPYGRREA